MPEQNESTAPPLVIGYLKDTGPEIALRHGDTLASNDTLYAVAIKKKKYEKIKIKCREFLYQVSFATM